MWSGAGPLAAVQTLWRGSGVAWAFDAEITVVLCDSL